MGQNSTGVGDLPGSPGVAPNAILATEDQPPAVAIAGCVHFLPLACIIREFPGSLHRRSIRGLVASTFARAWGWVTVREGAKFRTIGFLRNAAWVRRL